MNAVIVETVKFGNGTKTPLFAVATSEQHPLSKCYSLTFEAHITEWTPDRTEAEGILAQLTGVAPALPVEASLNREHRLSDAEAKPVKKTIKAGRNYTARSIGDYDCIYTINVLGRRGRWAIITELKGDNKQRRVMVREDQDGNEYLRPDSHSFAPMFRAID